MNVKRFIYTYMCVLSACIFFISKTLFTRLKGSFRKVFLLVVVFWNKVFRTKFFSYSQDILSPPLTRKINFRNRANYLSSVGNTTWQVSSICNIAGGKQTETSFIVQLEPYKFVSFECLSSLKTVDVIRKLLRGTMKLK